MSTRFHSALYRGELMHARRDAHAKRVFTYPVYVASIDLAELPVLDRELRLFSHGRRNVFALHARDYTTDLESIVAAHELPRPHTTRLVTNLATFGYVFNPVSFFINYDAHGEISSAIAEVNNTYGGNHRYVLGPAERITSSGARVGFRARRVFFVSPFLHGPMTYDFWFDTPLDDEHLEIEMFVNEAEPVVGARELGPRALADSLGPRVFTARLTGTRAPLSDRTLLAAALRYPFMTAQVIGLIHWQAIKLRLLGVP